MIELPQEYQDLLAEQLDEYLATLSSSAETPAIVQDMLAILQAAADECEVEIPGGDLVAWFEADSDLEDNLLALLTEELEGEDLDDLTGEDIISLLEKFVEIEWVDEDEESYGVEELDEELDFEDSVMDDPEDEF
ncbi:MAG: hypothetical protein ABIO70_23480 [Pseudomonadota bacterium]